MPNKRGRHAKRDTNPAQRGRPRKQPVTDISTPEVKPARPAGGATPTSGVNNSPKPRGRPRKIDSAGGISKVGAHSQKSNRADVVDLRRRESHPSEARGWRVESSKAMTSNDKIRLPHRHPDTYERIWANAKVLASTITDHYAMSREEQAEALKFALLLEPGAILVELGVTHGHTAAILCYGAKLIGYHYCGIDNFTLEGSALETRSNLDRIGLPYTLLEGNTQDIPWNKPIDYLIIDANHDVMSVTRDTKRWLPFVQPGGFVLFHAYNPQIDQTDPHWGIKNCVETYCGYWETLSYIPSQIIKRKPLT